MFKNDAKEIEVLENQMIVSSTDKEGKILYANDIFCNIAGYTREEVIGQPHSIVRHPDMPKAIFKLLWQRALKGEIIYAFVKNRAKNGDYYWVKSYVKPVMKNGEVVKITSYRKPINSYAKSVIVKLYADLTDYEKNNSTDESLNYFVNYLKDRNLTYDQFMDRLSLKKSIYNKAAMNIDYIEHHNAHIIFKSSIINAVDSGNTDIEVIDSHCCDFGKWCKSVENESFTGSRTWQNVLKHHDRVHTSLSEYVQKAKSGANKTALTSQLDMVSDDTKAIFENLVETIDCSGE